MFSSHSYIADTLIDQPMFRSVCLLVLVTNWLPGHCLPPVPPIYRKAEGALSRYLSKPASSPVVHSLLNIIIHDKRAKAFTSDRAVNMALQHVGELNGNDEQVLRQLIFGANSKTLIQPKPFKPTADVKEKIIAALDNFFVDSSAEES